MWNKIAISISTFCTLTGCGNILGEADNDPTSVTNAIINHTDHRPNQPIGLLSEPSSDANVAAVEDRLSVYLQGNISRITFAEGTVPYLQSAGRSEPPMNLNIRGFKPPRGLTLVIRHLELAAISELSGLSLKPCETGSLYTGYAAANQSLDVYLETETGPVWDWAIPYGLVVCDTGKNFDVLALPVGHIIFAGDTKKIETLRELPEHHPFISGFKGYDHDGY